MNYRTPRFLPQSFQIHKKAVLHTKNYKRAVKNLTFPTVFLSFIFPETARVKIYCIFHYIYLKFKFRQVVFFLMQIFTIQAKDSDKRVNVYFY